MRQPIPFGKYLLLERINVGGMAEIFLARSRGVEGFKRILAIKKILPTMAEDEEFIAMFVDEARIAAELSHAGIVQIFELGKFQDDYYIAMEFVHGKDMRYIQERNARESRPMNLGLAAFIAHRICESLDYAHNKRDPTGRPLGIIHRDISPQNVILSYEGEVKICDFGIAKAANRSQKTQAGVLKGKFGYMSPEQVRGLPLDGRSDIFTVGTLLYEMVTLERLFLGESDFSTLEKVRNADVVPPSSYNREVSEELEEIILRALAKEVEDRYQNSTEMADALQAFLIKSKLLSSRDLSNFMRETFQAEYEAELRRLEEYQHMPEPEPDAPVAQALPAQDRVESLADSELDAKTLIFASSDPGAVRAVPPPVPGAGEHVPTDDAPWNRPEAAGKADLADARTMIFAEPAAGQLADAKTMIFTEPATAGDREIYELPTVGLQRPRLETTAATGPKRRTRSAADRLFFPLAMITAVLLGYSVFTTLKLQANGAGASPASSLELVTWPTTGVQVVLDGRPLGTVTPVRVPVLEPGTHRLKVTHSGYRDIERELEVAAGQRLMIELALQPAVAPEGADPVAPPKVEPPKVEPPKVEPPKVEPPKVQPPKPQPPKEAPTVLVVTSEPSGATVVADGRKLGRTPLTTSALRGDREVKLALRLNGYEPAGQTVRLEAGQRNAVNLTLAKVDRLPVEPAPQPKKGGSGFLMANTRPWSKVFVDGKYTGRETPIAPDKKLKLSVGKHQVTFETPGGKRYDFEVEIPPDETVKLIKRLE